jgi:hypothetical protein
MAQIITLEFPDFLANSMKMSKNEFGKEIKISGVIKLFELGKFRLVLLQRFYNYLELSF